MVGDDAKKNQLLDALRDHDLVKAALIMDRSGDVKSGVGRASALTESTGQAAAKAVPDSDEAQLPKENIYLVGVGDDYLLTLFDDGVNFDKLKEIVDSLITELEF